MKIDKNKVTSIAGVKKTLFDKLVGHMDKYADKIIGKSAFPFYFTKGTHNKSVWLKLNVSLK